MSKIYKIIVCLIVIIFCCNVIYAKNIENEKINLNQIIKISKSSPSYIDLKNNDKVTKSILNNFIQELKPYLKDVISDEGTNYEYSTKEIFGLVFRHPVKFITSIYDYTVDSVYNVFSIAEKNAKVKK